MLVDINILQVNIQLQFEILVIGSVHPANYIILYLKKYVKKYITYQYKRQTLANEVTNVNVTPYS